MPAATSPMIVSISGAYWITRGAGGRPRAGQRIDQQVVEARRLVAGEQHERLGSQPA